MALTDQELLLLLEEEGVEPLPPADNDNGLPAPNNGLPAPNNGLPAPNNGLPAPNNGLPPSDDELLRLLSAPQGQPAIAPTGAGKVIETTPDRNPGLNALLNTPFIGDALRGLGTGLGQAASLLPRGLQTGAEIAGFDSAAENLGNIAATFERGTEATFPQAEAQQFWDIQNPADLARFASQMIPQAGALIAGTLLPAAVGGAVAGPVGALGGTVAGATALSTGEARREQEQLLEQNIIDAINPERAGLTGLQNAALDLIGLRALRFLPGIGDTAGSVAGNIAKATAGEGLTELAQEANLIRMRGLLNDQHAQHTPEDFERLVEAAVVGAIAGGGLSTGSAILDSRRLARDIRALEELRGERAERAEREPAEPEVPRPVPNPPMQTVAPNLADRQLPATIVPEVRSVEGELVDPEVVLTPAEHNNLTLESFDRVEVSRRVLPVPTIATEVKINNPTGGPVVGEPQPLRVKPGESILPSDLQAALDSNVAAPEAKKPRYVRHMLTKLMTQENGEVKRGQLSNKILKWSLADTNRAIGVLERAGIIETTPTTIRLVRRPEVGADGQFTFAPATTVPAPGSLPEPATTVPAPLPVPSLEPATTVPAPLPVPSLEPATTVPPPVPGPIPGATSTVESGPELLARRLEAEAGTPIPPAAEPAPAQPAQGGGSSPVQSGPAVVQAVATLPKYHESTLTGRVISSRLFEPGTNLEYITLMPGDIVSQIDDNGQVLYRAGKIRSLAPTETDAPATTKADPGGLSILKYAAGAINKGITVKAEGGKAGWYTIRNASETEFQSLKKVYDAVNAGEFANSKGGASLKLYKESLSPQDAVSAVLINENVATIEDFFATKAFSERLSFDNAALYFQDIADTLTKYPGIRDLVAQRVGDRNMRDYEEWADTQNQMRIKERRVETLNAIQESILPVSKAEAAQVAVDQYRKSLSGGLNIEIRSEDTDNIPPSAFTTDGIVYFDSDSNVILIDSNYDLDANDPASRTRVDLVVAQRYGLDPFINDKYRGEFDAAVEALIADAAVGEIFKEVSAIYKFIESKYGAEALRYFSGLETIARVFESNIVPNNPELLTKLKEVLGNIFSGRSTQRWEQLVRNSTQFMRVVENPYFTTILDNKQKFFQSLVIEQTSVDPTTFAVDIDPAVQNFIRPLVEAWATEFGVSKPVVIQVAELLNDQSAKVVSTPENYTITISPEIVAILSKGTPATSQKELLLRRSAVEIIAHEFGHIMVFDSFASLADNDPVKQALLKDHAAWVEAAGKELAAGVDIQHIYKEKLAPAQRRILSSHKDLSFLQIEREYALDIDEWMADRIAAALSSQTIEVTAADTIVDGFFKRTAKKIRDFWTKLVSQQSTEESIIQFLRYSAKRTGEAVHAERLSKFQPRFRQARGVVNTLFDAGLRGARNTLPSTRNWLSQLMRPMVNRVTKSKHAGLMERSVLAETISFAWNTTIGTAENIAQRSGGFRRVVELAYGQSRYAQMLANKYNRMISSWTEGTWKLAVPQSIPRLGGATRKYHRNTDLAGRVITLWQMAAPTIPRDVIENMAKNLIIHGPTITRQVVLGRNVSQLIEIPSFTVDPAVKQQMIDIGLPTFEQLRALKTIQLDAVDAQGAPLQRDVSDTTSQITREVYGLIKEQFLAHFEMYIDAALVDIERRMILSQRELVRAVSALDFTSHQTAAIRGVILRLLSSINEDSIKRRLVRRTDPITVVLDNSDRANRDLLIIDLLTALRDGSPAVTQPLIQALNNAGINSQQYTRAFDDASNLHANLNQDLQKFQKSTEQALQLLGYRDYAPTKASREVLSGFISTRRFGKWAARLRFVDANGENLDVTHEYAVMLPFMRFESLNEARMVRDDLQNAVRGLSFQVQLNDKSFVTAKLKATHLAITLKEPGRNTLSPQELFEANESYGVNLDATQRAALITAMTGAEAAIRRRALKRYFVPGESPQYLRGYASNLMQGAYGIAKRKFKGDIEQTLSNDQLWQYDPVEHARLRRQVRSTRRGTAARLVAERELAQYLQYHGDSSRIGQDKDLARTLINFIDGNDDLQNNDTFLALRSVTAILQLGGSIAGGIIQLSQTPLATVPYLASYNKKTGYGGGFGMTATTKALLEANVVVKQLLTNRGQGLRESIEQLGRSRRVPGHMVEVLLELHDSNLLDAAQFNALIGSSMGVNAQRNITRQKLTQGYMLAFTASEQYNRIIASVAGYKLFYKQATQAGRSSIEAQEIAKQETIKLLRKTQGEYGLINRQPWARSGIGSVLMMYQIYPVTMVELARHLGPGGKLWMAAILIAMSGVAGLPFYEDIEKLIDSLLRLLGFRSRNASMIIDQYVKNFGEVLDIEDLDYYYRHGVLDSITGANISSRLSLGDLLPDITGPFTGRQTLSETIDDFLGPVGGVVYGAERFVRSAADFGLTDSRTLRAFPAAGTRNVMDTYMAWRDGYFSSGSGNKVTDADSWDLIYRALGFTTQETRDVYDTVGKMRTVGELMRKTRRAFMADLVYFSQRNDREGLKETLAAINAWNESVAGEEINMTINITQADLKKALTAAAKPLEQRAREALPTQLRPYFKPSEDFIGFPD